MAFIRALYGEYAFVMLVMVLGLMASMTLAWTYQQNSDEKVTLEFERSANDRTEVLRKMLGDNRILLNTLSAFYRSDDDNVTANEFNVFTKQLLKDHPYLEAIEWAPQVRRGEREGYIKREQQAIPGYRFTEKDSDGNLVEAKQRDEYFPLYYVQPLEGNEKMLGYDLAADPDTAPALAAAREMRQVQASGLFREWEKVDGQAGVLFAVPIHRQRKARDDRGELTYEALDGFVLTVISLPKLMKESLLMLKPAGLNVVIEDQANEDRNAPPLYIHPSKLSTETQGEVLQALKARPRLSQAVELDVGGRKWKATFFPARGLYETGIHWATIALLAFGVIFTGLAVFYMLSRIREHERISMEVADRTEEVARAKKRIETILLSTHEGILGVDNEGKIIFTNPRATSLLGYSKRELVGQDHHSLVHHSTQDGQPLHKHNSVITQVLMDGRVCSTSDHVLWKKDGKPMQVEYTASPVLEGDDVAGAVIIFHDITERKSFEQQLEFMARHDQMTGLANRGLFADRIKKAMFAADQATKKVGVAYFDLNDFKPVNDKLGHAAGDLLLKTFATKLKEAVGNKGIAARMGGDEFTLMAEGLSNKDECLKIIDTLLESLKAPVEIANQQIRITASIGVAFYPDDATAPDALVSASDAAMYRAKQAKKTGGIKYAVYEASLDAGNERKKEAHG